MKYLPVLYARQLAESLAGAYKLHDETGKCQYVSMLTGCVAEGHCQSSTMIFNKVASPQQKHDFEKLEDQARYMNYQDANDHTYGTLRVTMAEMKIAVVLAEIPEAKKDMMQYCKHFATLLHGDHLADAVKFYEESGAPILANIVREAMTAPLPSEKPHGYMKAGSEGMW